MTAAAEASEAFGHKKVDRATKIFYGIGAVAYGIKNNGFDYFLLFFYNAVLGLPAPLAALALLITLVVDAISDPLVGNLSDNWRSKLGRRHPFMYLAAVPVAVSYYFLWNPPFEMSHGQLFWYLLALAILVRNFITLFEVPNTALVAEFTGDYDQRTSLMSFRYAFGWWGGLLIAYLAYAVFLTPTETDPSGLLNREGFGTYGFVASLIMLGAILTSAIGTHRHIPNLMQPPEKQPFDPRRTMRNLAETLGNRSFLAIFISALFLYVAQGFQSSMSNYVLGYFWELTTPEIRFFTIIQFGSAAFALFLATRIAKGREKKHVAITLLLAAILNQPLPMVLRLVGFFPGNESEWLLPILMAHTFIEVTIFVLAGVMISSMIADLVEDSQRRTKRRSEGLFFASRTFAQKVVSGVGISLVSLVLELARFPVGAKPGEVPQETLNSLGAFYVPVWIVFGVASALIMLPYRISRTSHDQNVHILEESELIPPGPVA